MAEEHHYPVICSHSWFRDLLYSSSIEFDPLKKEKFTAPAMCTKVAHEAGKRGDQIERIGRLGGVVAPIINQGDIAGCGETAEQEAKVPEPCAGSSTSWAQAYLYAVAKNGGRGVAVGTDINGAASPCPGRVSAPLLRMGPITTNTAHPSGAAKSTARLTGWRTTGRMIDHRCVPVRAWWNRWV